MFFKKVASLAFVPASDVVSAYDLFIKDNSEFMIKFTTFMKYFERNYVGELKRGRGVGRKEPRFAIKL